MQYSLHKTRLQRWFTKLTLALTLAIGVNASALIMLHYNLADLDHQAIASELRELPNEARQLIGKWQLTILGSDTDALTVLFTPEGSVYVINPSKKTAVKAEYQVNSENGQVYLDIFQGSFGSRATFSINSRGQLLLQQLFMPAIMQQMYYNSSTTNIVGNILMPNLLLLKRISNDTKLEENLTFPESIPLSYLAWQSEAKVYVGVMNRGHQAFFLEKGYFTNKLGELEIGIKDESENYKYQVVVLDSKKAVQHIALAKKDSLKSYIGLVYTRLVSQSQDATTFALLCESQNPTRKSPPKFKLSDDPICPEGYVDAFRK